MLCKGKEQVMLYYYILLWSKTQIDKYCVCNKNEKIPIKQLNADVQVKWCFLMVLMTMYYFITHLNPVYTKKIESLRALPGDIYFWIVTKTKNWQNGGARFSVIIVIVLKTSSLRNWMGAGCSGLIKEQILMKKCAPKNGYLFNCLWRLLVPLCTV